MSKKYPELVPDWLCKTPITVSIYSEDITETGAPIGIADRELLCNYQDSGQMVMTANQEYVRISGNAYFNGDPFPEISNITSGEVVIHGESRKIQQGTKNRNPDGTVNNVLIRLL